MRGERDSIPDSSEDTLHHVIRPILMPSQPSVECVQAAIDRGQSDQAGQDNLSPHLVQNIKKKKRGGTPSCTLLCMSRAKRRTAASSVYRIPSL